MRLYKDELYKLLHKKFFLAGVIIATFILVLFFWFVEVGEERSSIDGKIYKGYEAVQQDQKITKEIEGTLTDKKVLYIIETYGFPQTVEENYPGFRDANYLNNFVTLYLSDGYIREWNDYKIGTKVYPLADTTLGEIAETSGQDIPLFYTKGWTVFLEVLQMGMVLGSILIILGISVVFSDESQTGMLQIIFTTEEGKHKDVRAKILAAFTLAMGIYAGIISTTFILCSTVYGMDGGDVPIGLVIGTLNLNNSIAFMPAIKFTFIAMFLAFIAALVLCAMTLWVSAHFYNSFHSVVIALICWGMPVLIRIFFGGFAYLFVSGTPVFLIMTTVIWDISSFWFIPVSFSILTLALCVIMGYNDYKRKV